MVSCSIITSFLGHSELGYNPLHLVHSYNDDVVSQTIMWTHSVNFYQYHWRLNTYSAVYACLLWIQTMDLFAITQWMCFPALLSIDPAECVKLVDTAICSTFSIDPLMVRISRCVALAAEHRGCPEPSCHDTNPAERDTNSCAFRQAVHFGHQPNSPRTLRTDSMSHT